jgi:hypothetical protein
VPAATQVAAAVDPRAQAAATPTAEVAGAAARAEVAPTEGAAAPRVEAAVVPTAEEDSLAPAAVAAGTRVVAMVAGPTVPQQPPVGHTAVAATAMVQRHPAPWVLRPGRLNCTAMLRLGPLQRPTMDRIRHGRMAHRDRLCRVIDRTGRCR